MALVPAALVALCIAVPVPAAAPVQPARGDTTAPAPTAAAEWARDRTAKRRSGTDYMSPALQALQRDDAQNPAQLWIREGADLWQRQPDDHPSCAQCHAGGSERGMAARHPAWDTDRTRPVTLAERIDMCRQKHQRLPAQGPDGAEVLALAAYLAQASRGLPIQAITEPRLHAWVDRGEQLWRQRMGQLHLACTQCHDQHAGARLGGATIPQAHPTGYPIYRLEWQALGSLPRRLRGCLVGVRAEPFPAGAEEWVALELYLRQRAAGMALEGPAVRP